MSNTTYHSLSLHNAWARKRNIFKNLFHLLLIAKYVFAHTLGTYVICTRGSLCCSLGTLYFMRIYVTYQKEKTSSTRLENLFTSATFSLHLHIPLPLSSSSKRFTVNRHKNIKGTYINVTYIMFCHDLLP